MTWWRSRQGSNMRLRLRLMGRFGIGVPIVTGSLAMARPHLALLQCGPLELLMLLWWQRDNFTRWPSRWTGQCGPGDITTTVSLAMAPPGIAILQCSVILPTRYLWLLVITLWCWTSTVMFGGQA